MVQLAPGDVVRKSSMRVKCAEGAAGFAMGFRVTREVHATITDASRLPWETVVVMSPMVATTTQVA